MIVLKRYSRGYNSIVIGDDGHVGWSESRKTVQIGFFEFHNHSKVATHFVEMDCDGARELLDQLTEIIRRIP